MKLHWICLFLLVLYIKSCHSQQKEKQETQGSSGTTQRRPKPPLIDQSNNDDEIDKKKIAKKPARRDSNEICELCRFMYTLSDKEYVATKDVNKFCVRLRQVEQCMSNLKREKFRCPIFFMLVFKTGVNFQVKKHKCAQRNVTADDLESIFVYDKNENKRRTEIGQNCRYRQKNQTLSELKHCGMFGDPHIKTFFGRRQTCVLVGSWTLVDNEYMRIQAVNEIVQETQTTSATATKEISILFKERDLVCSEEKFYKATSRYLPEQFINGSSQTGPSSCHIRIYKDDPDSVTIKSCRSNTTILLRRVGKYLTFNIISPFEIVNTSSGLCYGGCPANERVDHLSFFNNRIAQNDIQSNTIKSLSPSEAMELCSEKNVTDFYYDSCVFDLLTTGDKQFSEAARLAMFDAQSMDPKLRLRRENSIVLNVVQSNRLTSSSRTLSTLPFNSFLLLIFSIFLLLLR